jgi:hypothetical protein
MLYMSSSIAAAKRRRAGIQETKAKIQTPQDNSSTGLSLQQVILLVDKRITNLEFLYNDIKTQQNFNNTKIDLLSSKIENLLSEKQIESLSNETIDKIGRVGTYDIEKKSDIEKKDDIEKNEEVNPKEIISKINIRFDTFEDQIVKIKELLLNMKLNSDQTTNEIDRNISEDIENIIINNTIIENKMINKINDLAEEVTTETENNINIVEEEKKATIIEKQDTHEEKIEIHYSTDNKKKQKSQK